MAQKRSNKHKDGNKYTSRARHDDGLDGDFIEEEWQFVRSDDESDEDDALSDFGVVKPTTYFDDDADADEDDIEYFDDDETDENDNWDGDEDDDEDYDDEDDFEDWVEEDDDEYDDDADEE